MSPVSDPTSSLSARGAELAAGPSIRDLADRIFTDPWDPEKNPDGLINLGTAENYLMLDDVADFLDKQNIKLHGRDLDYGEGPWGSPRLRKAMTKFINSHFNPHTSLEPSDITITNGCSALFNALGFVLADPGDGILLTMPSYVAFPADFGALAKMKPIFVPFNSTNQFAPNCIQYYETARQKAEAGGTKVKALMLCNPHNPLGRCYPRSTLTALLSFCQTHKIHLIADEIYALSVYTTPDEPLATPFTSILSLDWEALIDPNYLHFCYGMSKDLAGGGLRIGCLWSKNTALQRAVSAVSNFHWSGTISSLLTCTILEDDKFLAEFLTTSCSRLADANMFAKKMLSEAGIEWAPSTNAGYYLWINLSPWLKKEDGKDGWEREEALMQKMMEDKLFLTGGHWQGAEEPGWFRFVFTRKEAMMQEGMKRLKKVTGIA